jgi:probable phosphoglycerate mutase
VTRLILWRHGNTDWNAIDRIQGQTDTALNDRGRSQAAAAAPLLAALKPDAIVASDLSRAADTAAVLARLTNLPVHTDPRLRERSYGTWEGLTLTEVAERFPAERERWRRGEQSPGCGVEDLDDLGKRVSEVLQELGDANPGGTVVVTTHGGAARQGCGHLLGWPVAVLRTIGPLQNCHWTDLRHEPVIGWRLRAHNLGPFSHQRVPAPV